MKAKPSAKVVGAWVQLMRAQQAALSQIERKLKSAGLPPLAWYDALLELDRAGEKGLRPFELQRELLLPQYGLSRLLDRLEAVGYVERRPSAEDGRGQSVAITRAGRDLRRRMWPVYADALNAAIAARLTDDEAGALEALLGRLAAPPSK